VSDAKLESYLVTIANQFVDGQGEVNDALRLIRARAPSDKDPLALQLLALRRYLRMGGQKVHANWAWTPEEQRQNSQSGTAKALMDEATKVQANFARTNPGYTLAISPLRSLERQVATWNSNGTVDIASRRLLADMNKQLVAPEFPDPPTGVAAVIFSHKLRNAAVNPEPSSAAPGTSDHGQGRAVDFVVMRGGTKVADTDTAQIAPVWKHGGWERRLIAAAAGTNLVGPLSHPYEPWHWRIAAGAQHLPAAS
jgi:hypothetical protein